MSGQTKGRIGFLLLGGIHHIYHIVPVAAEMAQRESCQSVLFVRTRNEARICRGVLDELGGEACDIIRLSGPAWLRRTKIPMLLYNLAKFKSVTALVTAERTSTCLKRFAGLKSPMIHIPHGAGDRAQSYDKRIAYFDFVIPAGPKDRERMMALGLVSEENSACSGYIKTAALKRIKAKAKPLFSNMRKTVLYSPHFDQELSTWPKHGESVLKAFSAQNDFNLIFAPHIRLFKNMSFQDRRRIEAYADGDKIKVDLGSPNSIDMTYTLGADIYLGDASSQVYEFLSTPKPCVFFGPEPRDWQQDSDYAHWRYGDVVFNVTDVMKAVAQAETKHKNYRAVQIEGVVQAFGQTETYSPSVAADIISDFVFKTAPEPSRS